MTSAYFPHFTDNCFFSDVHSNNLIGTPPSISVTPTLESFTIFSLSSNYFSGNIPNVTSQIDLIDYRFNYFDNCDNLCCLTSTDCSNQSSACSSASNSQSDSFPIGVEKAEWTELNVTLFGEKKRIIQIETHLTQFPHIFRSFTCPTISSEDSCSKMENFPHVDTTGMIPLTSNMTISQTANTNMTFVYYLNGNNTMKSLKVTNIQILSFLCCKLTKSNRLLFLRLLVIQICM